MNTNSFNLASSKEDIILVGPNGSGKSKTLRDICINRIRQGQRVIAVSNTQFSRLPDYSRKNYHHIRVNPGMTNSIFKALVVSALDSKSRSYSSMRDVLSHTGYLPILNIQVSIGRLEHIHPEMLLGALEDLTDKVKITDEIRYVVENLYRASGDHQFDLEDIRSFFFENELLALLIKHQTTINRAMRILQGKVSVFFSLTRSDGQLIPLHKASSGELTLITLAMFILSNSDGLDCVLIDEPENSLHPQWQSGFLEFISAISRRENITFQVASHSPILLTGALTSERRVKIIRCRPDHLEELNQFQQESDDSVEELLWEAFDVVTPASQFVAKRVSDLLWLIEDGKIEQADAIGAIKNIMGKSISRDQIDFLQASIKLIETTSVGEGGING